MGEQQASGGTANSRDSSILIASRMTAIRTIVGRAGNRHGTIDGRDGNRVLAASCGGNNGEDAVVTTRMGCLVRYAARKRAMGDKYLGGNVLNQNCIERKKRLLDVIPC